MKKIILIIVFVLISLTVFLFLSFSTFSISGTSMEPTLKEGQSVFISKISYISSGPERGDIVLIKKEGKQWAKRVIALAGETIEIKEGKVYIDGAALAEPYIKGSYTFGNQNIFLGSEQYYVLGDNREPNQSIDSRIFGSISKKDIIGKVLGVFEGGYQKIEEVNYQF